jgi:hypothetical protein
LPLLAVSTQGIIGALTGLLLIIVICTMVTKPGI